MNVLSRRRLWRQHDEDKDQVDISDDAFGKAIKLLEETGIDLSQIDNEDVYRFITEGVI